MRRSISILVLILVACAFGASCRKSEPGAATLDEGEAKRLAATELWEKRVKLQDFVSLLGEPVEKRSDSPESNCYVFRVDKTSSVIVCAEDESGVVTWMTLGFR